MKYRRIHQIIAMIHTAFFLLAIPSACFGMDTGAYTSLADIPGVTEDEIQAVNELREKYDSFIFGSLGSTEAFYDETGQISGYSVLFCEWLTELFDIRFVPEIYEWGELFPSMKADFTGELTATEERKANLGYLFTDAISERSTKFFSLAGSPPRSEIIKTRPLKLAFMEGSTTSKAAESKLKETSVPYEAIFINDYDAAYRMMKSGEADAFIHEMVVEAAFDEMEDVVAEDFLPVIFEPVSLSTQNQELKPIIDIVQKVIENGGIKHFVNMYERGMKEYARHKLFIRFDIEAFSYLHLNTTVKYLAEFDNYPISFYNTNENQWQGIVPDILKEITALTGLRFEPANEPGKSFSELMKMLENGEGVMLSEVIYNSERKDRILWPKNSTMSDNYVVVSLEDMPGITVQRIMQLKVGLQSGSAYSDLFNTWFPGHPNITYYSDVEAAFDGLERGEVDILMCSMHNLLAGTNYQERTGFKANLVFDYTFDSFLGFNKNEKVLCSIVDNAMEVIDTEAIASRWMRKTFDYRAKIFESQQPYLIGVIILFLIVIVLVFILYLRNRNIGWKLDNLVRQRTAELDSSRQDLSAALKAAEGANRAKSAFLATMSHEIRTPMNAILGMAEIALRNDTSGASHEHIFMIKQAGTNLLSLINDILDFSKIEAGKMEIVSGEYLLSSLVNDVISIIRMRAADSHLLFTVNIDCNIPNELYGDEIRIRSILLNLLGNAVKFTPKGHISFSVLGETDGDAVTLTISVSDSGKGMKPDDMDKLFEKFVQVETVQNKGVVGTGLGLAITRSLVHLMGGEISVASEYGKGSAFTVTLPQKIRNGNPMASVEKAAEKRVLVYELREIYANSIVCTIDNLGVDCTLAATAPQLREEMESGAYSHVFIAAGLYESVLELCERFDGKIQVALLAGFGEAVAGRNLSILAMPVYSTSVANILNGTADSSTYNESSGPAIRFTAPGANILIVDDIETNLLVIEGLLMPYGMRITLCGSGAEAIAAMSGASFDLILMDHMMPDMDGIETAGHIRNTRGNSGVPIVALTANAIIGAKDMFMEAGFDDYLSKPIDVLKLNAMLEKWIPREKQQKHSGLKAGDLPLPLLPSSVAATNPKLLAVFRRDAEKAAATLRTTMANGDLRLFTTTVHAMKSALGNIAEAGKAELAFELEKAGRRGDADYITANAGPFIEMLESLIQSLPPAESGGRTGARVSADKDFLSQQLVLIRTACSAYDETAAYAALDRLKEKVWPAETAGALEALRDMLYLHSDFEEAANQADILLLKGT